ncbi:NC domain-containing-related-like protein [Melia azedarach]|uniref:NC domain-containing-related-like protein n=1 Tax=Melia azedarach TaxID=155640 RepID=A0ACC1YKI1_MELAZ|nr:NC domain-containing-related-like protein [Melia azedarach]
MEYTWARAWSFMSLDLEIQTDLDLLHFRSSSSATEASTSECQICGNKAFSGGMVQTCLDCFQDGCSLLLYDYESTIVRQFLERYSRHVRSPSKVVKSAYNIKERQRQKPDDYSAFVKNCEHFATFCKTGLAFSVQSLLVRKIFSLGNEISSYTDEAESGTD